MTDREVILGVVTWLSDTGLVLDNEKGADGKYVYRNFTKPEYRDKAWETPSKGDTVKLALNKGWIYAIKKLSGGSADGGSREDHIAKSVALKAAVDFYANREATGPDVVTMAEFFYEGFLTASPSEEPPPSGPAFGDDGDPGPTSPFA